MRFNRNPLFIPTIPLFYMHINSDHDLKITIKNPNRLRPLSTLMQRFKKYPLSSQRKRSNIFSANISVCVQLSTLRRFRMRTQTFYTFLPIFLLKFPKMLMENMTFFRHHFQKPSFLTIHT